MPCATVSDPHGRRGLRAGTVHLPTRGRIVCGNITAHAPRSRSGRRPLRPPSRGCRQSDGARALHGNIAVPGGALYGRTIRSTIARGTIRSITLHPQFDWSQVVVVTADDIPGDNVVQLIRDDQPVLASRDGEVRHREEPILLLARPTRELLEEAAGHIRIEYQPQSPVFDVTKATEIYSTIEIAKADVPPGKEAAELLAGA